MREKKLIALIKTELESMEQYNRERKEEDKLERVEQSNFDDRDNAIYDLGVKDSYENVLLWINKNNKLSKKNNEVSILF